MTLDEAAQEIAKDACASAAVYLRFSIPADQLDATASLLPPGCFTEGPMVLRARELLKDWPTFATPEVLKDIDERAMRLHAWLCKYHSDPSERSKILRPTPRLYSEATTR